MERVEGPQTPFEVYCDDCQVTFAAGTPRCVHCGRRLGGRTRRSAATLQTEMPPDGDIAEPSLGRRLGGMSLWVLIAIGAALSRMCAEG